MADRHRSVHFRLLDSRGQRLDAASSRDGLQPGHCPERDGGFLGRREQPDGRQQILPLSTERMDDRGRGGDRNLLLVPSPRTRAAFLPCEHKGSRSRGHCGGCRRDVLRGQVGRPRRRPPADETRRGRRPSERRHTSAVLHCPWNRDSGNALSSGHRER